MELKFRKAETKVSIGKNSCFNPEKLLQGTDELVTG